MVIKTEVEKIVTSPVPPVDEEMDGTPSVTTATETDRNENSTTEMTSPSEPDAKAEPENRLSDQNLAATSEAPLEDWERVPLVDSAVENHLNDPTNLTSSGVITPLQTERARCVLAEAENCSTVTQCSLVTSQVPAPSEERVSVPCVEAESENFRQWFLATAPASLHCYCDLLIEAGFDSVDFFADITDSDLVPEVPKAGHRKALLKLANTLKKPTSTAAPPVEATAEEVSEAKPKGNAEEVSEAKPKGNAAIAEPPRYAPGIHVVPHKVLVLNKAKAMKENPHLKPGDFVVLKGEGAIKLDDSRLITVLVVGASGSGKSTMINSLMNYLYDVRFEDEFRLKLILEPPTTERETQASSQTNQVFGYLLDTPPALKGKSLLIIDTPGFGDSRGVTSDEAHVDEIRKFFEEKIDYLNGVWFVCKAPDSRVTATQRWIFDKILGLFGKDIEDIINLAFTFADAYEPPALAAIKKVNIKYNKMFKLNNSAFFAPFGKDILEADPTAPIYWKLGVTAFQYFVDGISGTPPKSLLTTRTVLRSREKIRNSIERLRLLIEEGILKLLELERTCQMVVNCRSLIDQNKNFTYSETSYRREKKPKPSGTYNTVCDTCQWTCHRSCGIPNNADKNGCVAMTNGYCTECPKKCHWSGHSNLDYYWELVSFEVKKTNAELEARYVNASSDKSKYEQIISGIKGEFDAVQVNVYDLVLAVKDAVNELNRLALRPGWYHTDEYFDVMIEQETKEKNPNWQLRIEQLKIIKDRSKYTAEVASSDKYDPFDDYRKRVEAQARQGSVNVCWIQHEPQHSESTATRFLSKVRDVASAAVSKVGLS